MYTVHCTVSSSTMHLLILNLYFKNLVSHKIFFISEIIFHQTNVLQYALYNLLRMAFYGFEWRKSGSRKSLSLVALQGNNDMK